MNKRLISLLLVIAMLLTVFTIPALADTLPVFTIEDASVSVGDVFSVNITLTENSSICGGGFNVIYDNTKLEIINTSVGDTIRTHTGMVKKDYAANKIRVTWAGITPITLGGTVCTLEFKVIGGSGTTSSLAFENINAYDYDSKTMSIDTLNGTVSIAEQENKPTISINSSDTVAGSNVVASVNYNGNGNDIYGGTFEITYDSSKLKADAITDIGVLEETSYVTNLNYAVNKVKVSFASSEPIANGRLCDISFKVNDSASGSTSLSVAGYDFYDVDLNDVSVQLDGTILNITALSEYSKSIVSVETTDVGKDENAIAYVAISNASDVCGGSFDIIYDKDLFELVSAEKIGELSDDNVVINTTYAEGAIRVSWAGDSPVSSDGRIIRLIFKPSVYTQNNSEIKLNNTELYDTQSNLIVHTSTNGIVKFVNKEIKVSKIVLTDSMGISLDKLQPGEININVSVSNNSGEAIDPVMYVALYDNGRLSKLKSYSLPEKITTDAIGTYNVTTTVPENINKKTLKVFIWKSSSSLQPLSKPAELVYNGSYISIDMDSENYASELKAYVVSDEVSQISGKVFSTDTIQKIDYTVCDEYDNLLLSGTATAGNEFYLSPVGFVTGNNILTVVATENSGNIIEKSVRIFNTNESNMKALDNSDDDGDLLVNCLEIVYGTDKNDQDSDSDGISDYNEIMVIGTNPLLKDSNNNGVNDADEDLDADGITNTSEFISGTNPVSYDTDNDGLSDGDEINTYNTAPTNSDTDNDGVNDGTEIAMNTDPLVAQSSFDVQYVSQNDSDIRASVNVELSSEQVETLSITSIEGDPMLNENIPGYMGSAYDFNVEGEFASATIGFEYDESAIDEDAQPTVYYFNEESQLLEELETTIVDGVAYAEVSHFSKYILLNKTAFDIVWNNDIKAPQASEENSNLDIVLVIDSSGSMTSNDSNNLRLSVAKEFVSKLSENDRAAIVDFDSYSTVYSGFSSSKTDLNTAIDKIDSSGGTSLTAGIRAAIDLFGSESYVNNSALKYIVMLTDGDGSYSTSLTTEAKSNNIVIYTIGLGSGVRESVLTSIAEGTDGKYYFASAAEDLGDIFVEIGGETIDYSTDSSNDGISDGICDYYNNLIFNGTLVTGSGISFAGVDFRTNSDYDGDGLLNGEELEIVQNNNKVYMKMKSDPTRKDTDGDTLSDAVETKMFNTNPLVLSIGKAQLDIATYSDRYTAYQFSIECEQSITKKLAIFGGNYLFGSNYDKAAMCKEALLEMFSEFQAEQENKYKLSTIKGVLEKVIKSSNDIAAWLKVEKGISSAEDIEFLTRIQKSLLEKQEMLLNAQDYAGMQEISNDIISINTMLGESYGNVEMDVPIGVSVPGIKSENMLDDISFKFKLMDEAMTIWKFVDSYSDLSSKTEIILNNINILNDIISYSNDGSLVQAAIELRAAAHSELSTVLSPLKDILVDKAFSSLSDATVCLLELSKSAQATVFWITVAKNLIDSAMGVSDTSKKAVQVIALSDVSEIMKNNLMKQLSIDGQNYYAFDENDLYTLRQLLLIRKAGEKRYLDMRGATNFIFKWLTDYESAKSVCEGNYSAIDEMMNKYSQDLINKRRIKCV